MRGSGIIRRIDDLGRIVVPKAMRETLQIRDGDPLELTMDIANGAVIVKKYDCFANTRTVIESAAKFIASDDDIDAEAKALLTEKLKEALAILEKEGRT